MGWEAIWARWLEVSKSGMTGRPGKLGRVWDELWAKAIFHMGFNGES